MMCYDFLLYLFINFTQCITMNKLNKQQPKTPKLNRTQNIMSCRKCRKTFPTQSAFDKHYLAVHAPTVALPPKKMLPARGSSGTVNKLSRTLVPQDLGTTAEGRAWALKCLHPGNESGGGSYGIPDTTSLQICLPEARGQLIIAPPKPVTGSSNTWDCVLLIPDVIEISSIVYVKWSSQSWAEVRNDLNSATPTFTPPAINYYSLFSTATMRTDADSWRTTSRSATLHLNASEIADQGMLYADNWTYEETIVPSDPGVQAHYLPLLTPAAMTERSPKMYVNRSKKGCYVICYPIQAVGAMPYNSTVPGISQVQFVYPDQTVTDGIAYDAHCYSMLRSRVHASAKGGYTDGFMVIEGLAADASLQVKTKQGIEMVPTNATIAQAFTRPSPMLDRVALDAVARVAQSAPGAYPADYNDLSKVIGSIGNIIRGIAGPVSGIADFVSGAGIPIVSDISAGIRDILKLF